MKNSNKTVSKPKKIKYTSPRKNIEEPIEKLWDEVVVYNPHNIFEYKKNVRA